MKTVWKNLPVSRKLYSVVGVMAVLIATELFTLLFAMNTLSAVRALVGGEGLWSKAQKDAVMELLTYSHTRDEKHYEAFRVYLSVPLGDHTARLEMLKPVMDTDAVTRGFVEGRIAPSDIPGVVKLLRRFYWISYVHDAIGAWTQGDEALARLIADSGELHAAVASGAKESEIEAIRAKIYQVNKDLTALEIQFSDTLGQGSRWLEHWLMILLVIAVAMVESTGLFLTITFSRGLSRVLRELHDFAIEVGKGCFTKTVPVRSGDELGGLAGELNRMAAQLGEASSERRIAEHANRIKNLFLANMSHEMRTPLTAILGFVELLKEPTLEAADRKRYLEVIERTGGSLARIINDVLDISKVEAGKLQVEKAMCTPQNLIEDLEALLRLKAEEKGVGLKIVTQSLPEKINTDPTRLKQILINVIGNAIKYTDRGEVTATFEIADGQFICRVRDTGIGISKDGLVQLFQPFSQIDSGSGKGGAGLGLVLSKRLAQLLGGDVRLERSTPGAGSTFIVSIGLDESAPKEQSSSPAPALVRVQGNLVLVVEDTKDNQYLAKQYLLRAGFRVETADNGIEAIEAMAKSHFDLVIMDMQMPLMDGYTATTELRRRGYTTPIVALTAHAMKQDYERCIAAGCTDFLAKPFRRNALIEIVGRYCGAGGSAAASS